MMNSFIKWYLELISLIGLALRYVNCDSNFVLFGLRTVDYASLEGGFLYVSHNTPYGHILGIRPVVSLGSDIKVTKCTSENTDSSATDEAHMHQLSKAN